MSDLQRMKATAIALEKQAAELSPDEETLSLSNDTLSAKKDILHLLQEAETGLIAVQAAQGTLSEQEAQLQKLMNLLASAEAWVVSARQILDCEAMPGSQLVHQIQAHQV